ncbi:MAG: histone deacetylase [Pseudomonadota bacterium]
MRLPVVYHPQYEVSLKPGHRFPMSKYGYLRQHLAVRGLAPPGGFFAPVEAGAETIMLAHEPGYVDRVFHGRMTTEEVKRIGLPPSDAMTRRVRLSAAGTTLAARLALEHGVACNAAGGSHHAARGGGAGYCVFNDVAVAAATLLAEGVIGRVLILDLDVHQGDGTADIFSNDPRVFTVSVHGARNYPAVKVQSDLDIPLADGTGDAAYLAMLDEVLKVAEASFHPDLIFYNAGVDVLATDRLGRLGLTPEGLRQRDRRALAWAGWLDVPVVGVLGGGYGEDPDRIAAHHATLFEEADRLMRQSA